MVAIIALAVSSSTLTWQVLQFLLSSSRPKVYLGLGAVRGNQLASGRLGVARIDDLLTQGFDTPVATVRVHNRGRMAVSVTSWGIDFRGGMGLSNLGHSANDHSPLPHRLDPGAEAQWVLPLQDVHALLDGMRDLGRAPSQCRARIGLGTGKTQYGKWISVEEWSATGK